MSPATGTSVSKKAVARVAAVDLDAATASVLRDCFRQFGIDAVAVSAENAPKRLQKEKFEACVLPLNEDAAALLEAVRASASNRRMVIYGLADSTQSALRFSKYGINAVLTRPVERAGALKIVRSTYFLVLHEFRRYVRVPLTAEVRINTRSDSLHAIAVEMSGGGMSVEIQGKLEINATVELVFALPGQSKMSVNAVVCWTKPAEHLAGFRFDINDERRSRVKKWIEDYLEIA